jgi:hypothetical protein
MHVYKSHDYKGICAALAVSAALLAPSSLIAQEDEPLDRTPVECLSTTSIDRTDVVDDQTIIFFMRGKRIFRNYLPRKCPGLEREDRFSYQTTNSRLCDIDTITVLEQWGSRLQPGFTCALGAFHPISAEEAEALKELEEDGRQRDGVEVEPAELPEDEADEAADAPSEERSEQ